MINSKRAMSEIVTVILLISFVLVVAGIISSLVFNLNDRVMMSPKKCLDVTLSHPVNVQKVCFNSTSNEVVITLFRERADKEIFSLGFIFETESGTEKFRCSSSCGNCEILSPNTQKIYFIPITDSKKFDFLINDCFVKSFELNKCTN